MILASGCFDGLHAGHVRYLRAAKACCRDDELLLVSVAPDVYIEVAKQRPAYWRQGDRLETVRAIDVVDAVVAQQEPSVSAVIRAYRPRLFLKGPDWRDRLPEDVIAACDEVGTEIGFVESVGRHVSEARHD